MARRTAAEAAATRRDLVEAALDVFGGCGYAGATLEQIAGRAGVTRGAVYHHFADKADVYDAVLRQEADRVIGPLMTDLAGSGPPLQRLHAFVVAYCTALGREPRFRRAIGLLLFGAPGAPASDHTRRGYEVWTASFEAVLEDARERGDLSGTRTPRDAARTVVAVTLGATTAALHAPAVFAAEEHATSLADTLIAGLTP